MMKLILMSCVALLTLSGCSTYSEIFDCPAGHGVGCRSLSSVNRMVEQGVLPYSEDYEGEDKNMPALRQMPQQKENPLNLSSNVDGSQQNLNSPKLRRIWFAGYQDDKGNYHSPRAIIINASKTKEVE